MMFCIYPIVAKHFEMFFEDMDNEFLNEVQSRNGFSNSFIVFVSGVMKGYVFTVISINTRCGNNRSAEVSLMYLMVISGVQRFGFART